MYPHWVEKTNVLESSFSAWDSGAFLFVSPLEPSLPWEPCRPGNKQSFVSTDPLCPAARLQTSTPVLIGNHRRGVRGSRGRGSFLASTCAFIIAHQNKHSQAGVCGTLVTTESKAFSPPTSSWHQRSAQYIWDTWFILWHGFVLIKPVHSPQLPINTSIACHKFTRCCPRGIRSVNRSVKWTTLVNVSYIWLHVFHYIQTWMEISSSDSPFCTLTRTQKPF